MGAEQVEVSMARSDADSADLLHRIAREEADLAKRAAAGDREAFDQLYDRYFVRMAHVFRHLPEPEAQAKIWEALEQVFASLHVHDDDTPLAARAFRVAHASLARQRAPQSVRGIAGVARTEA
jgi:hypothetical protein